MILNFMIFVRILIDLQKYFEATQFKHYVMHQSDASPREGPTRKS